MKKKVTQVFLVFFAISAYTAPSIFENININKNSLINVNNNYNNCDSLN